MYHETSIIQYKVNFFLSAVDSILTPHQILVLVIISSNDFHSSVDSVMALLSNSFNSFISQTISVYFVCWRFNAHVMNDRTDKPCREEESLNSNRYKENLSRKIFSLKLRLLLLLRFRWTLCVLFNSISQSQTITLNYWSKGNLIDFQLCIRFFDFLILNMFLFLRWLIPISNAKILFFFVTNWRLTQRIALNTTRLIDSSWFSL